MGRTYKWDVNFSGNIIEQNGGDLSWPSLIPKRVLEKKDEEQKQDETSRGFMAPFPC
jgi:hypothetical protein